MLDQTTPFTLRFDLCIFLFKGNSKESFWRQKPKPNFSLTLTHNKTFFDPHQNSINPRDLRDSRTHAI